MMQRTSIMLPNDLKVLALKVANKRGISLGELVRESLIQICIRRNCQTDPFFEDKTVYDGDIPKNIAENHDDYLY